MSIIVAISAFFIAEAPNSANADDADQIVGVLGYSTYYTNLSTVAVDEAMARLQQSGKLSTAQLAAAKSKVQLATEQHRQVFLDNLATTYRDNFSTAELAELLQFYTSPVGQKLPAFQPVMRKALATDITGTGLFVGIIAASLSN